MKRALVIATLAIALGACSSTSKNDVQQIRKRGNAVSSTVPVNCDTAMTALGVLAVHSVDDAVERAAEQTTLNTCSSRGRWLQSAAAHASTSPCILCRSGAAVTSVLYAICADAHDVPLCHQRNPDGSPTAARDGCRSSVDALANDLSAASARADVDAPTVSASLRACPSPALWELYARVDRIAGALGGLADAGGAYTTSSALADLCAHYDRAAATVPCRLR